MFILRIILTLVISFPVMASGLDFLAVQDGGRVKPFNTFAKESLQLVYGKKSFKSKPATDIVFSWVLAPEHWVDVDIIQVRHSGLRKALALKNQKQIYRSASELFVNDRMALIFQELTTKLEREEKLNSYYQAVQTLRSQLTVFQAIRTGEHLRLVPSATEGETMWLSLVELDGEFKSQFQKIVKTYVKNLPGQDKVDASDKAAFSAAVNDFNKLVLDKFPEAYSASKLKQEVHLNEFHPFQWSWIAYLISAIFFIALLVSEKSHYKKPAWGFLILGFLLHTYGMILRMIILERPPVSNMYETVVWVPWTAAIFAYILHRVKANYTLLLGGGLVSTLCLILTDLAPNVLDPTLAPLRPVLNDSFWLTTHVLIIVSSYAAFFLAFVLADILLFYYIKDEKAFSTKIKEGVHAIYRSQQIGVVLLAAGTILGGVWADYSWGRFWGWDPKETWALIALLGYIAVLHGRLIGWVKDFAMVILSVLTFSLVIMAWYGVNFVLGAGLHSYGFGTGGVEYVFAFVALHIVYVAFAAAVRHGRI